MLIKFTFENFLSFKGRVTLDFLAGTIKEHSENTFIAAPHLSDFKLLKSIGMYGPNSSGKSNVLKAFSFMRDLVINSSKESNATESIKTQPFKLSTETENKGSFFEIFVLLSDVRYKYGFTANSKIVESEWLIKAERKKEELLFIRHKQDYSIDKKFKGESKGKIEILTEMTRSNSLFLSVLSQFNIPPALQISKWFNDTIIAHDTDHFALINFSAKLISNLDYRKWFNDIIKISRLGIEGIDARINEIAQKSPYSIEFLSTVFQDEIKNYKVATKHYKYDEHKKKSENIFFDLVENESLGTQKYFALLGPILVALKENRLILIDEIDARLHSQLLTNMLSLFNSYKYNPKGAQLVYTSHNTHPLKSGLRRDQMVFVNKDELGVSTFGSLYKKHPKVRNDASFDKDYLQGRYTDAPPAIGTQLDLW